MNLLKPYLDSVLIVVIIAGAICMFVSARRNLGGPPRKQRKHQRIVVAFLLIMAANQAYQGLNRSPVKWGLILSSVVMTAGALVMMYQLGALPEKKEAYSNYVDNPGLCGQCDYDLTGNTTGVCPECGWRLPTEPPPTAGHGIADSKGWEYWWKKWEIEALANWKKTLFRMSFIAAVFLAIAIWVFIKPNYWIPASVILLADSFFIINVVRVAKYGWRHRKSNKHIG